MEMRFCYDSIICNQFPKTLYTCHDRKSVMMCKVILQSCFNNLDWMNAIFPAFGIVCEKIVKWVQGWNSSIFWFQHILLFYPRPVLTFGYCRCLHLCVCLSVYKPRAIIHHPFKLGSPNLDQRCKIPWFRFPLSWMLIDLDLKGQIKLKIILQSKCTTTRVNTKIIFDSLQFYQRRVLFLFFKAW